MLTMDETESAPETQPFTLTPVESKPSRTYRKGSKYDPILEAFHSGSDNIATVSIPEKDANYIRTQLNKVIKRHPRKYRKISVSVVNETCYLQRE
jgi:hypothetical protein